MNKDMTKGPVMSSMVLYSIPMILGNMLQQCYNLADTFIVGKFIGKNALAAVGSSFSLMTFLTSILLGLCMGSGVALAYILSAIPAIGLVGIWWSVPIGWALADAVGILYFVSNKDRLLSFEKADVAPDNRPN